MIINHVSYKEINPSRKYILKWSIVYKSNISNGLFCITETFEIFLPYKCGNGFTLFQYQQ